MDVPFQRMWIECFVKENMEDKYPDVCVCAQSPQFHKRLIFSTDTVYGECAVTLWWIWVIIKEAIVLCNKFGRTIFLGCYAQV